MRSIVEGCRLTGGGWRDWNHSLEKVEEVKESVSAFSLFSTCMKDASSPHSPSPTPLGGIAPPSSSPPAHHSTHTGGGQEQLLGGSQTEGRNGGLDVIESDSHTSLGGHISDTDESGSLRWRD